MNQRKTSGGTIFEAVEPRRMMSGSVKAGDGAPLFDFTDAYYLRNGIDPTKIAGRPTGTGSSTVLTAPDADHKNIAITALAGMHDDGGKPNFFGVLGTVKADAFTNDAAGRTARQIADTYIAYIFPKAGSNPLSPASKREDEIIPLNNGYFSNDPTQIWREAFVNYVPGSMASGNGKKVADKLIQKNGVDADGTPFLKTFNDIQDAEKAGIVTVKLRANDGSQGAPWFFCAVYKSFGGTSIPPGATLTYVKNADGTAVAGEQDIKNLFDQLTAKPTTRRLTVSDDVLDTRHGKNEPEHGVEVEPEHDVGSGHGVTGVHGRNV